MSNDPNSFDQPNPNASPTRAGANQPGQTASPYDPNTGYPPDGMRQPPPTKSGWGCWLWGCLGVMVFTLLGLVGMGFGAYWFLTGQVEKYTDTQPADIPVIEISEEELGELQSRIESFTQQVRPAETADAGAEQASPESGKPEAEAPKPEAPEPEDKTPAAEPIKELVLTADDINALINSNEEMRGKAFVQIVEGRLLGEVSIPMDKIPGGKGRFFNADAEFDVSMQDGILVVRLTDASVKGEPIPAPVMQGFSEQNLAKDAYKDAKNAEILRKFESIEVVDDAIHLRLKDPPVETLASPDQAGVEATSEDAGDNKEISEQDADVDAPSPANVD